MNFGWKDSFTDERFEGKYLRARVIESHGELCRVITERGELPARRRGILRETALAVGDFVYVKPNETGDSLVCAICPRRTVFSRAVRSGHAAGYVKTIRESVVAANFDIVFILMSLNHDFNLRRLQRYIAATLAGGARGVIVLTKADRAENREEYLSAVRGVTDMETHVISAVTGEGIDDMLALLAPGVSVVFLGSSGVGKSTLVNTLAGEELMPTSEIREDDSKGRHTTTHRKLFFMQNGAMVIDTPGLRELGLWEAETGIDEMFEAIKALEARCRFSDCRHGDEPGCAIRAALDSGALDADRWSQYCAMNAEIMWVKRHINTKKAALREKISKQKLKY